jgi:hypothetical protein
LRRAAALAPDDTAVLNDMAWVLATCAEDSLRDAPAALEIAHRVARLTAERDATMLDTLAAAEAATGQFAAAQRTAARARDLAVRHGDSELAARIATRALLYEQGRPYRAPVPLR